MTDPRADATAVAVSDLRLAAGGSDPWTRTGGKAEGGFTWRDAAGNQFDVTISLTRPAPRLPAEAHARRLRDAWQGVMLGDDSACTADAESWRFAERCRAAPPVSGAPVSGKGQK